MRCPALEIAPVEFRKDALAALETHATQEKEASAKMAAGTAREADLRYSYRARDRQSRGGAIYRQLAHMQPHMSLVPTAGAAGTGAIGGHPVCC